MIKAIISFISFMQFIHVIKILHLILKKKHYLIIYISILL